MVDCRKGGGGCGVVTESRGQEAWRPVVKAGNSAGLGRVLPRRPVAARRRRGQGRSRIASLAGGRRPRAPRGEGRRGPGRQRGTGHLRRRDVGRPAGRRAPRNAPGPRRRHRGARRPVRRCPVRGAGTATPRSSGPGRHGGQHAAGLRADRRRIPVVRHRAAPAAGRCACDASRSASWSRSSRGTRRSSWPR